MTDLASSTEHLPEAVWIRPAPSLQGSVAVPGDKSISHRSLIIGALADGTSTVRQLSDGEDVVATASCLEELGISITSTRGDGEEHHWTIEGGRERFHTPRRPLDCGNSGTTMRLMAGVMAGFSFRSTLIGDRSLHQRPMDRIALPLETMGASVKGNGPRCLPPLEIEGNTLFGITWEPPIASSQVKSAILLAGLTAKGETVVREPLVITRTHTEDMLARAGADITVESVGGGQVIRVRPSSLHPTTTVVPGDPSQAAFWVVGASVIAGSDITVPSVYAGAARVGYLDVLARMGAVIDRHPIDTDIVNLMARTAPLRGTEVRAAEIPSLDEVPILAIAAAKALGETVFRDVSELRLKETDRLQAVHDLVKALGAGVSITGDDLHIEGVGDRALQPFTFDSRGDHRMAMAAVIGALAASGECAIHGFSSVATSYQAFLIDLERLAGDVWRPSRDA